MKLLDRVCKFCDGAIGIIAAFIVSGFFVANMLCTTIMEFPQELAIIKLNQPVYYLSAILVLAVLLFVAWFAEKINEKILMLVLSAAFFAAGIYLIVNVDGTLRFDALYCYETALELAQGKYTFLETDGYIFYFPHQLGMVTYEYLLGLLSQSTKVIFFI